MKPLQMPDKIARFFEAHVKIIFCLVFAFMLIRVLEYSYAISVLKEPLTLDLFFSRSVNFDSLFIFLYSVSLIIPLFILSLINFRIYSFIDRFLAFILVFIDLALTQYFLTSNSLLTSQLFEFSLSDVGEIIFSEFTVGRLPLWIGLISVTLLSGYFLFFKNFIFSKKLRVTLFICYGLGIIIALANVKYTFKEFKYFDSNYQYLTGNSKISYFIKSYYVSKEKNTGFNFFAPKDLENSKLYHQAHKEQVFTSREFPFIHKEPYSNVLGEFFTKSNVKPNVVIIISESLSAVISGKNTLSGSLTPFTDSLMKAGLSWQYFLSNANKSYGAIPNILASAPPGIGERGFINTKVEYLDHKKYPAHTSLVELLKQNGYVTNYYYGGWGAFDNVCFYLAEKHLDNYICEGNFDHAKYGKRKEILQNKVWGYNDKQLFEQSMTLFKKHVNNRPFLSVYQTLSSHSPYNLSEDSYYTDEYLDKKLASINVSKNIYEKIEKKILSSVFSPTMR
jgi:phosphoglycerol transferase MdoB-like AlkP superfamily enzyme